MKLDLLGLRFAGSARARGRTNTTWKAAHAVQGRSAAPSGLRFADVRSVLEVILQNLCGEGGVYSGSKCPD